MDGSKLLGYVGSDIVQLGPYFARTDFGCIDHDKATFASIVPCLNHLLAQGHWEYNGIMGVGIPDPDSQTVPLLVTHFPLRCTSQCVCTQFALSNVEGNLGKKEVRTLLHTPVGCLGTVP